jgi:N-formylglutamate amidohydrolase
MTYSKIILAIPHSAQMSYEDWLEWKHTNDVLKDMVRWTDWSTDEIFKPDNTTSTISKVVFPLSRFTVDVERLYDDPLAYVGRGFIYTTSHSGSTRIISKKRYNELFQKWASYRRSLVSRITDNSLIIDCHSFPEDIDPSVDINIGYNIGDWSRPDQEVIIQVCDYFKSRGFSVGLNHPYSNSIVPSYYPIWKYHSIMIEVNKGLYMQSLDDAAFKWCSQKIHQHYNSSSTSHFVYNKEHLAYDECLKELLNKTIKRQEVETLNVVMNDLYTKLLKGS